MHVCWPARSSLECKKCCSSIKSFIIAVDAAVVVVIGISRFRLLRLQLMCANNYIHLERLSVDRCLVLLCVAFDATGDIYIVPATAFSDDGDGGGVSRACPGFG